MGKNKVNAARLIALAASKLRSMLIATFVAVVAAKKTAPGSFSIYINSPFPPSPQRCSFTGYRSKYPLLPCLDARSSEPNVAPVSLLP